MAAAKKGAAKKRVGKSAPVARTARKRSAPVDVVTAAIVGGGDAGSAERPANWKGPRPGERVRRSGFVDRVGTVAHRAAEIESLGHSRYRAPVALDVDGSVTFLTVTQDEADGEWLALP